MTDPGFAVEGIHRSIPFRRRTVFPDYQQFGDGEDAVVVEAHTASYLRAAAEAAHPQETGGLLSGRTLRDADGQYVMVSGFVQADVTAGAPLAFHISPPETARLRDTLGRDDPAADVVGWWHSHPRASGFSPTDRSTQRMFAQSDGVGLLVFAQGEPWATAYLGPTAEHLGSPVRVGDRAPGRRTDPAPAIVPPQGRPQGSSPRRPAQSRSARSVGLGRSPTVFAAALVLSVVLIMFMLLRGLQQMSQLKAVQDDLVGRVGGIGQRLDQADRSRPAPMLEVDCTRTPRDANSYTCVAVTSGPDAAIRWELDGKAVQSGRRAVIPAPRDGRDHLLQAIVDGPGGSYGSAVETISSR